MEEIEWWEFDSLDELAEQAAGDIAFVIQSAIEAHDGARIALPGGKTPDAIFKALLKTQNIDWSKVTILPGDDRLVGLDHELSNYAKLQSYFGNTGANIVSLVDEAVMDDYQEAGRLADERLKLVGWPLDLVCLGMGADGHTASIFPGADLDKALNGPRERRAVGVRPDPLPPEGPVDRVTLTAAAIGAARAVMVVISGSEKRRVLEQAIKEGPLSSLPIGRVLAELENSVDVLWSA